MTKQMLTRRSAMIGAVVFLVAASAGQAQTRQTCIATPTLIDTRHPKHFVHIYELTSTGQKINVVRGKAARDPCAAHAVVMRVNHAIDLNSRIVLEFDREWILAQAEKGDFDADILITANLDPEGGPIEVPGYSQIGKPNETASVRIRSASDLIAILREFAQVAKDTDHEIDLAINRLFSSLGVRMDTSRTSADSSRADDRIKILLNATRPSQLNDEQVLNIQSDLIARRGVMEASLTRLREDSTLLRVFATALGWDAGVLSVSIESLVADLKSLGSANARTDMVERTVRGINERIGDLVYGFRLVPSEEDAASLARIKQLLAPVRMGGYTRAFANGDLERINSRELPVEVGSIRKQLLAIRPLVEVPLKKVIDVDNRVLIRALAHRKGRDADVLIRHAADVVDRWYPQLERGEALDSSATAIYYIHAALEEFGRRMLGESDAAGDTILFRGVASDLVSYLKDTDILLSKTSARAGDNVTIRISNGATISELHRDLIVRLQVRDFGLDRDITDSFLFIQRQGTGESADTVADPTGTATRTVAPKKMQFEPSAGASLGWVYKARGYHTHNGDRHTGFLKDRLPRWLEPGFGLNVSFPRFGSVVTEFRNSSGPRPDTTTTTPQRLVVVTEESSGIDVAAGAYVSLFGNSVTFTYGWNLTSGSGKNRRYLGIGFSFVSLARQAEELRADSSKGKQ